MFAAKIGAIHDRRQPGEIIFLDNMSGIAHGQPLAGRTPDTLGLQYVVPAQMDAGLKFDSLNDYITPTIINNVESIHVRPVVAPTPDVIAVEYRPRIMASALQSSVFHTVLTRRDAGEGTGTNRGLAFWFLSTTLTSADLFVVSYDASGAELYRSTEVPFDISGSPLLYLRFESRVDGPGTVSFSFSDGGAILFSDSNVPVESTTKTDVILSTRSRDDSVGTGRFYGPIKIDTIRDIT